MRIKATGAADLVPSLLEWGTKTQRAYLVTPRAPEGASVERSVEDRLVVAVRNGKAWQVSEGAAAPRELSPKEWAAQLRDVRSAAKRSAASSSPDLRGTWRGEARPGGLTLSRKIAPYVELVLEYEAAARRWRPSVATGDRWFLTVRPEKERPRSYLTLAGAISHALRLADDVLTPSAVRSATGTRGGRPGLLVARRVLPELAPAAVTPARKPAAPPARAKRRPPAATADRRQLELL